MVSFIYLDLGGVVIDDFSGNNKWQELKDELGITESSRAAFEKLWAQYSSDLNTNLGAETLLVVLRDELKLPIPENYKLLDGFVSRFTANPLIWPLIESVRHKVRTGLLTNMYPGMFAAIGKRDILPDVKWDVVIDSSVELLQKPDSRLFELAEKRSKAKGNEILFIDNSEGHVNAAKAFGWNTFLYDSSNHDAACSELQVLLSNL